MLFRKLMIACGIDPKHADPSVNQQSNEEDSSSDSTSTSGGSSSRSSLSSSSSSAIGSDGSKLMLECVAGTMCRAPTDSIFSSSPHNCWCCNKKIHSALQCESSVSEMIVKNPSVVGMSLNNGYIIEEGDDNETRAICFACLGLGPLSIFFTGSKHGEPDSKLAEVQFLFENKVTEALPFQPAVTKSSHQRCRRPRCE